MHIFFRWRMSNICCIDTHFRKDKQTHSCDVRRARLRLLENTAAILSLRLHHHLCVCVLYRKKCGDNGLEMRCHPLFDGYDDLTDELVY